MPVETKLNLEPCHNNNENNNNKKAFSMYCGHVDVNLAFSVLSQNAWRAF